MELVSVYCEEASQVNDIHWSNELYPGEFDDLRTCNLYSDETCEPTPPRINSSNPKPLLQSNHHQDREVLQVLQSTYAHHFIFRITRYGVMQGIGMCAFLLKLNPFIEC